MADELVYENASMLLPQPATLPMPLSGKQRANFTPVTIPNPLIANISNDILKPLPSSSANGGNSDGGGLTKRQNSKSDKKSSDINLAWFEKEDDPFDNLELQTINDMEELASVLNETRVNANTPVVNENTDLGKNLADVEQGQQNANENGDSDNSDDPTYENVELRAMDLKVTVKQTGIGDQTKDKQSTDVNYLPPVPIRRDLIGRGAPLPPIGGNDRSTSPVYANSVNGNIPQPNSVNDVSPHGDSNSKPENSSFQARENVTPHISKPPVIRPPPPKPAKPSPYSRHSLTLDDRSESKDPVYDNFKSVSINPANSLVKFTPNPSGSVESVAQSASSSDLNFVNSHFGVDNGQVSPGVSPRDKQSPVPPPRPPSRPSSNQVCSCFKIFLHGQELKILLEL